MNDYIQKALEADSAWLDIEGAPNQETELFIKGGACQSVCSGASDWREFHGFSLARKYFDDDFYTVSDYFYVKPTHYAPLDAPDLLFAEVKRLRAHLDFAVGALKTLSRLGNGEHLGNSTGNVIAQAALKQIGDL